MKNILKLLFFLITIHISAQDHINWSSIQLQTKLSENMTFNLKPIFRFNNDISTFQNASLDLFVNRKLGKGWSAQFTTRTWWIPNEKPRQFLWPDIAYGFTKGNFKIDNRLRYHLALDINDRNDPDFFRYIIQLTYNKGKIKPFFAIEPWFRLNGIEQWQRIRYIPGISWSISDTYGLSFTYWREESLNIEPEVNNNIWLLNLLVKI